MLLTLHFSPVTGHSFIPPDRIFGLIEKTVKKQTRIVKGKKYYESFQSFETVILLADIQVGDWKSARNKYLKLLQGYHLQI